MRVISGKFGGRQLKFTKSKDIRPLSDKVKEALFNMLDVEGQTFLDAYAGTGQIGIEALSRGASSAVFVERDKIQCRLMNENIRMLNIENIKVFCTTFEKFVKGMKGPSFDIIVANPPFAKIDLKIIEQLFYSLNNGGILTLVHSSRVEPLIGFHPIQTKKYGDTSFTIYQKPV